MLQYQDWHYKVSSRPKSITVTIGRHYRANQRLLVKDQRRLTGEFVDLRLCGAGRYVLSQYFNVGLKMGIRGVPVYTHDRLLVAERRWL